MLEAWMRIGQPLEPVMADYESIFNAWEDGGVRGLAVGRMYFRPYDGSSGTETSLQDQWVPTFSPDPRVYRGLDVEPPAEPRDRIPEKRRQLGAMLDNAKARGWPILIFEPAAGMGPSGPGHILDGRMALRAYLARTQDTLEHYPQVDGAIMDGPEFGYEIHPYHRSSIFEDLPQGLRGTAEELGYDYGRLVAAKDKLFEALHHLAPATVRLKPAGEAPGLLRLFGDDLDLHSWVKFRADALTRFYRSVSTHLAQVGLKVRLGVGPRTAAFAPLCGYDLQALAGIVDYLFPKHYFWNRGVDGLYGTVARYLEILADWNPGLTETEVLAVARAILGLELPGVQSRFDLELGFPEEFFTSVVRQETAKALASVGDPGRVIAWVDTGRSPHGGDPMPARDLHRLLACSREAGLRKFLYHNQGHLTQSEWSVISALCGNPWKHRYDGGYTPPG